MWFANGFVHGSLRAAPACGAVRAARARAAPTGFQSVITFQASFATRAPDGLLLRRFKWAQPQIDAYLRAIVMAAEHSGGES